MKHKGLMLFWINVVNLVLMLGLVGTSVILRWVLPHGSGGGAGRGMGWRGGRGPAKEFFDMTRHEWGDIHFYLAIALVIGIALHLILHAGWIRTCVPRYLWPFGRGRTRRQISEVYHPG